MSTNSLGAQQQEGGRMGSIPRTISVQAVLSPMSGREMGGVHGLSPPTLGSSYPDTDVEMRAEDEDGNSTVDVGMLYGVKAETSPSQWTEHAREWQSQTTPTYGQGHHWNDSPGSSVASSPKQMPAMGKMTPKGKGKKMRQDDDGHSGCDDEVDFEQAMLMDVQRIPVKTLRKVIPKLRIQCYMMSEASHGKKKFKHLWDERPPNWPMEIPFKDPNNAAKEVKKPGKEELRPMFEFLRELYKKQNQHNPNSGNPNQEQPSDETEGGTSEISTSRYSLLPSGADKPVQFAPAIVPLPSPSQPAYSREVNERLYLQQLLLQRQQQQRMQQMKEEERNHAEYQGTALGGSSPPEEMEQFRGGPHVKQEPRQAYVRQEPYYTQSSSDVVSSTPEEFNGRGYDGSNGIPGGGVGGGLLIVRGSAGSDWQGGVVERGAKIHEFEERDLRDHDLVGRGLRGRDLEGRGLRAQQQQQQQESRIPPAVQELRDRLVDKERQVIDLSSPEETKVKVIKVIDDVNMQVIDRLFHESTTVPLSRLMFLDAGHQMEALLDVMSVLNRFDQDLFENGCGEILRKFSSASLTVAPFTVLESNLEMMQSKLPLFSHLFSSTDFLNLSKILGGPASQFSDHLGELKAGQSLFGGLSRDPYPIDKLEYKAKRQLPFTDKEDEIQDGGMFNVQTGLDKLLPTHVGLRNKEEELKDGGGKFVVDTGYGKSLEVCEDKVESLRLEGLSECGREEGGDKSLGVTLRTEKSALYGTTEILEVRPVGSGKTTLEVGLNENSKQLYDLEEIDPNFQNMLMENIVEEFLKDDNYENVINDVINIYEATNQPAVNQSQAPPQSVSGLNISASHLPTHQSHSSSIPMIGSQSSYYPTPQLDYNTSNMYQINTVEAPLAHNMTASPNASLRTAPTTRCSGNFQSAPRKRMRTTTESAQEFLQEVGSTGQYGAYQVGASRLSFSSQAQPVDASPVQTNTPSPPLNVDQLQISTHSAQMDAGQLQMLTNLPLMEASQSQVLLQMNKGMSLVGDFGNTDGMEVGMEIEGTVSDDDLADILTVIQADVQTHEQTDVQTDTQIQSELGFEEQQQRMKLLQEQNFKQHLPSSSQSKQQLLHLQQQQQMQQLLQSGLHVAQSAPAQLSQQLQSQIGFDVTAAASLTQWSSNRSNQQSGSQGVQQIQGLHQQQQLGAQQIHGQDTRPAGDYGKCFASDVHTDFLQLSRQQQGQQQSQQQSQQQLSQQQQSQAHLNQQQLNQQLMTHQPQQLMTHQPQQQMTHQPQQQMTHQPQQQMTREHQQQMTHLPHQLMTPQPQQLMTHQPHHLMTHHPTQLQQMTHQPQQQMTHQLQQQMTHQPQQQMTHQPQQQMTHQPQQQMTHQPQQQMTHQPQQQMTHQPQQSVRQPPAPVANIPTTVLDFPDMDSDDATRGSGQRGTRPSTGGKTSRKSGKDGFKK